MLLNPNLGITMALRRAPARCPAAAAAATSRRLARRGYTDRAAAHASAARQLVVVRHGETDWNAQLRVQGTTDIPLNERGLAQAAQSAAALAGEFGGARAPSVVYSSGLDRALMTARAVADALADSRWTEDNFVSSRAGVRVAVDDRLAEWNLGCLEGLRQVEAAEAHPVDWAVFSDWCSPSCGPATASKAVEGGECMDTVRARAVAGMEAAVLAAPDNGRPVIAVTHGGVLGQLLRHAVACQQQESEREQGQAEGSAEGSALSASQVEYAHAANACVSHFLVAPGGRWEVTKWACTAHLQGDAAPIAPKY